MSNGPLTTELPAQARQSMIELAYSRANIPVWLRHALKEDNNRVRLFIERAVVLLDEWKEKPEYESKMKRKACLAEVDNRELAIQVAAAVLGTRTNPTMQQAAGLLAGGIPHEDPWDRVRIAGYLIGLLHGQGLYSILRNGAGEYATIERYVELDQFWLNETAFNLPMVCRPMKVVRNTACGYVTFSEPVLLGGKLKQHGGKLSLDVLNILNQQQLQLDEVAISREEAVPDELEDKEAFVREKEAAQAVYRFLIQKGNRFYLVWQFDSRGRMYCHGYQVNIQGNDWKRAAVSLTKKERIDDEVIE